MKNFNANYVESITQLNAEPRAYVEIETDLGYSIFLTTHSSIDILRDRYVFNFNGDGNIISQKRWNPDALDVSFIVEFYNGFDVSQPSRFFTQGVGASFNTQELMLDIESDGDFTVRLGGSRVFRVAQSVVPQENGLWRYKYNGNTNISTLHFNGDLVRSATNENPIGSYRDDGSVISIGSIPSNSNSWIDGVISNVKFWINTETTNDLVLDMPINDNSNTIKDYAGIDDGVLTAGTGSWEVQNLPVYKSLNGVISGLSTSSESVTPEKGFSVLGGGSIGVLESQMTDELRSLYENQETIFNKKVSIYSGTADLDINDYEKVQTLYVKDISNTDVSYSINLQTSQIFSNKKIFTAQATELVESFDSSQDITEIEVLSTDGFELVEHDAEWEDSPSEMVGYLNLTGQDAEGNPVFEIVKYWSKDAVKFYGDPNNGGKIERSVFNTGRVTATGTRQGDTATEINEHIYIDLATGKMLIALLTGDLYGQVGQALPEGWHAGVDASLINITSFEEIGFDLWNPSDDTGFHFFIDNPSESTAKTYIAREISRVASLAFLTDVNGEIKAKRFQQVIPTAGAQVYLDDNDILNKPTFDRKSSSIRNVFLAKWDYRAQLDRFIRTETIIDVDSINKNNITSRAEDIELKAIRNNSIEVNELLKTVTDGIRTRLTNPYLKPSIQTSFRRSLELEVMDVIGLDLVGFADYGAEGDINRPFEIQQIQHDWLNRTVSSQVFGSTDPASPIDISTGAGEAVIDHTGWRKFEDYLNGTFTDTGTTLTLTSDCTLGTYSDGVGNRRDYYYDGLIDLNGFQLRINGTVVIDANMDISSSWIQGNGRGGAGGEGQTTSSINLSTIKGDSGYFGSFDSAEEGVYLSKFAPNATSPNPNSRKNRILRPSSTATPSGVSNIENFVISVDENGHLTGIPARLNGRSGSGGLRAYSIDGSGESDGGNGGAGGCGLIVLASDFIYNSSSLVSLDASDVSSTTIMPAISDGFSGFEIGGGRGGAGWGGCLAVIIKDRAKPLMSNIDGIFTSKTSLIQNWAGDLTRPLETALSSTKNSDSAQLVPFRNSSNENKVNGVDYAGSTFLSKYISVAEVNIPQVGRDPIGLVPAPLNLTLTEAIDTPSTRLGNLSTVTMNVDAPNDDNYSYTQFRFRSLSQDAFYEATYKVGDEATFEAISDGSTYIVKAQSVSKQGVFGGSITGQITVKDVLTEPAIEPTVEIPKVTGLQLKNRIAANELSKFKSANAEFVWNAVSNNSAVDFGNEGALGAGSGSFDPYFKDYQVKIYDESNNLLRTEYTSTESYIYTFDKNRIDNKGTATRLFSIQVNTRGQNNQVREGVKFIVENPEPEAVTGISAKPSYNSIQVDFVSPNDVDYIGVSMRFRKVGVTAWSIALFIAGTSCNVADLDSGTEYEIELTSVDQFGNGDSTTVIQTTTKIESASLDDITTPVVIDENGGLLVTNNDGFTSVTGVSDGTWNQLPEPTIYTAINTDTDTQVFGVDVAGNAIIGAGDNAVSFIGGLIEFGDNVTIGSNVDQTVTVGSSSELNNALVALSKIVPAYKNGGFTAKIEIATGVTLDQSISFNGIDLSFIEIISVDPIVSVDISNSIFIEVLNGARSPKISTLFRSVNTGVGTGAFVDGGSSSLVFGGTGTGVENFDFNITINDSGYVYAPLSSFIDGQSAAITATNGAIVRASSSTLDNSGFAVFTDGSNVDISGASGLNSGTFINAIQSTVSANQAIANNSDRLIYAEESDIRFSNVIAQDSGSIGLIDIINTSLLASGSDFTNYKLFNQSIQNLATLKCYNSSVNLFEAKIDTNIDYSGLPYTAFFSECNADLTRVVFGDASTSGQSKVALFGSDSSMSSADNYTLTIASGTIIRVGSGSNVTLPQAKLVTTSSGIIF